MSEVERLRSILRDLARFERAVEREDQRRSVPPSEAYVGEHADAWRALMQRVRAALKDNGQSN